MEPKIEKLISYLYSEKYKYKYSRSMINELKTNYEDELYLAISNYFDNETNPDIRNRLANAFHDLGDRRALVDLMKTIRNPKTYGDRGTLVYAMSDFHPIEYIYDLVFVVINDTWEASGNSLDIIESLNGTIDEKEFEKCVELISNSISKVKGKRREDVKYLLEMFESE